MSEQTTQKKVSESQVNNAMTKFKMLYSSTGSVAIDLIGDFKFLVACAKDGESRKDAHAHLDRILNERKVKNDKWRAEHPTATAVAPTA